MSFAFLNRPVTAGTSRESGRSPRARPILVVACLYLLVIWSTAGGFAWRGYHDAVQEWKVIADNSSVSTAAYVHQALGAADLVLKSMQDWVADERIESDAQFRQVMADRRFFEAMRARIVGLPQAAVATIVAANGDVINSSYSYPPPSINVGNREAFVATITSATQGVFVSGSTVSRTTGQWTFFLSRPITAPSGISLGVVAIGLGNDFFTRFFRTISLQNAETISLFRNDGMLLATTASNQELLGRQFPDAVAVQMLRQGSTAAEVVDTPRWANPADRKTRIVAPRQVEGLPLLVSTTVGTDIYLADWTGRTYAIAAIALVLTGVTVFVAVRFKGFNASLEKADRLAAERRLLATLLDTPAALCAVLSHEGRILYCNDRFAKLLGADADPADALSDPALHGAEAALEYASGDSQDAVELDLRLERPGQAVRFLHVSLSRQMLPDLGACAILVGHDETERYQARAAIAQSAKMVTLGEMTTGMAHELSQPLNVMRMAAQNGLAEIAVAHGGMAEAGDDTLTMTDSEFRTFVAGKLNRIVAQVDRAADIVSRMRIFGRAPQGPPSTFDARDACRSAIGLVSGRLRSMNIAIDESLASEVLLVAGYQNMIEQVLVNLLLNARDALKNFQSRDKRIEVSARRTAEGRVLIAVSDNGPGVPEPIRDRIFEPFYTAKPLGEGTGLGLALSFGIVRDAGGTLSLLPGTAGACFQIDLPAATGTPSLSP